MVHKVEGKLTREATKQNVSKKSDQLRHMLLVGQEKRNKIYVSMETLDRKAKGTEIWKELKGKVGQGLILDGRISNTDETFYFIFNVLMNCEFECVGKKIFSFSFTYQVHWMGPCKLD